MVVVITLYNLTKQSSGLGCQGHFHFRTHITSFIDKNWEKFFHNDQKLKRKNLLGTIAGVLSQQSPEIFSSGTEIVGSSGWWKLSQRLTPMEIEKLVKNRSKRSLTEEEENETKKMKLVEPELDSDLYLDTEDDLLKELNQLKEEITASCGVEKEIKEEPKDHLEVEDLKTHTDLPWSSRHLTSPPTQDTKQLDTQDTDKSTHLDRYRSLHHSHHNQSLLAGPTLYDLFQSPYTGQTLHPFIYRDKKKFPRWLKLMCEVKHAASGKVPTRSPIDFCYVKPHHITAINALLQATFWPGIDMSESLGYPDFTVVALYKKLVVGCAFLVPDVCHNEAYISFLAVRPAWERSGIATFMLYHLTQTSHGKDITLHVSASNPAICLYHKFGFKTEELILNFYEKFLPIDSPHSPHALFLRLTR